MANYNVTLNSGVGKGSFAVWVYNGSTTGVGHTSGNPLDVDAGDTVTFIAGSGSGEKQVQGLAIFTNNANIVIAAGGANVVRTVASGSLVVDTITGLNQGGNASDTFFLERQAAASDTTPTAFNFTNQTGVTRSSTRTSANTVTIAGMDSGVSTAVTVSGGTYSKNGGAYSSANTTASNGTTFKLRHTSSSSYSTNTTTTLTVGGVSGSFVSTTEAAPATPSYTLTAPTSINEGSSGTINIATSNVATGTTLYWTVTSPGQFTGDTSGSEDTDSSGNASFSVTPTADSTTEGALTVTARIRTGSQGGTIVASDTFVVNDTSTAPGTTAPTVSSVTFDNPASANTTATVNLSATGSGGTLQYACEVGDSTPDNWQSGSTFTISRGSGTVYARARRSTTTNSNVVSATRPGFLTGDTAVSATSSTIANGATSASTTLSNATAGETYAVRVNNGSSNLATRTGNGAISFTGSLPSSGNTSTYEIFVRRPTSTGGDGSTYTATNDTFTVSMSSPAQDTTPNAFTLQNITNAGLSTVTQSVAQQVTGITGTVTVTVSGDGNPQVKIGNNAWTSGPTTITNNFYINARLTSSASNSTAHTATVTVGTYSEDFTVTTVAASGGSSGNTSGGSGTYGVEIYDNDGTTTVLSPSTRYMNFMQGPQVLTVPANGSALIQQDMTGLTTSNSDIAFTEFGSFTFTVTRITTGAVSSQGFQLNNANSVAFTAKPYILRF